MTTATWFILVSFPLPQAETRVVQARPAQSQSCPGGPPSAKPYVDCCTVLCPIAMLVPQTHLSSSWLAQERLSMAAWVAMTTDIIATTNDVAPGTCLPPVI